jgi:hypothetical protein
MLKGAKWEALIACFAPNEQQAMMAYVRKVLNHLFGSYEAPPPIVKVACRLEGALQCHRDDAREARGCTNG